MKKLQKLTVILLAVSFVTLFVTMSFLLITQKKSEIFLYIIELSILIMVSSFAALLLLLEHNKND